MAGGEDFRDRATIQSDEEGPEAVAVAVASGGSSMASSGADPRARASRQREEEVVAAAASGGDFNQKTRASPGAEPRASGKRTRATPGAEPRASGKRTRASPGAEPQASGKRTRASSGAEPRASGKRTRDKEVAAAAAEESQRTASVEDSPPSVRRRLDQKVGAAAPEEEEPSSGAPRPSSEVVRAQDVLSLPENLSVHIMRSLPRQMAIWQLNHQPATFRFQLRDGMYPSPHELTVLLGRPELLSISLFSLVVHTDKVDSPVMAGYLTRASECSNEKLRLEYHESVNDAYIFHLAGCAVSLKELVLKNVMITHDSLVVTPVFSVLAVVHLSYVRIDDRSLTRVVALCPSLNTLTLQYISILQEIVFEPPVSTLRSLTITMCCNILLLDLEQLCGLQKFFYHGPLAKMYFSIHARVKDMFLCSTNKEYPGEPIFQWLESAPDFSMLSVLSSGMARNLHLYTLAELQVDFVSLDSSVRAQFNAFLHHTSCSNLERLFLQLGQNNCHLEMGQEDPQDDSEIDLRRLSFIRAEQFDGNNDQMSLLTTLLLKAPRLDNLVLCSTADPAGLQMKVAFLKERSETAEVILTQDDASWPQPRHLIASNLHSTAGAE